MAVNLFFMGKGGVGKTTSSALNAVFLADAGYRVLLISLDPAHNLSDIFCRKLIHKPVSIVAGLDALEIDQNLWVRAYLKSIQLHIRKTYSYLSALNLDHYFKTIRHSPGLEEYALLMAFSHYQENYSDLDFLIFDMPPTALALKFFQLPSLSLIWIEQLLNLRKEIIRKRDIITKIKLIKKEVERDKVLLKINELHEHYSGVKRIFEDRSRTRIILVMNSDQLSYAESKRIIDGLSDSDLYIDHVIHNKMKLSCPDEQTLRLDAAAPVMEIPVSDIPLIGIETLRRFLKDNNSMVEGRLREYHKAC